GELGGILGHELESDAVHVREQLRDGRPALDRGGFEPALRQGADQIDQDRVVAIPGVEQSFEQTLVLCRAHHGLPFGRSARCSASTTCVTKVTLCEPTLPVTSQHPSVGKIRSVGTKPGLPSFCTISARRGGAGASSL